MRTSTILKVLILYLIIELLLECSGKPVKDQNKKKNEVTKKIHETKGKTINKKIENNKKKGKTKPKEKSKKSDEKNPVKKFAIDATKKAATTVADAVGASIMLGAGGLPLLGRLFIILEFGFILSCSQMSIPKSYLIVVYAKVAISNVEFLNVGISNVVYANVGFSNVGLTNVGIPNVVLSNVVYFLIKFPATYEVTKFALQHKDLVKKGAQQIGKIVKNKS